jgi:hypothetical protein
MLGSGELVFGESLDTDKEILRNVLDALEDYTTDKQEFIKSKISQLKNVNISFHYQYNINGVELVSYPATILLEAISRGNSDLPDYIIAKGGDINFKFSNVEDIVSYLAHDYNFPAIEKILNLGAFANKVNDKGAIALHNSAWCEFYYIKYSSRDLTKILLKNGFDILKEVKYEYYKNMLSPIFSEGYDIGEAPIKFIPLAWLKDELKSAVPTNNIYKFELYRGLKYYENKGDIEKDEASNYYPSDKGIDFANGCFADLYTMLVELDLTSKTNRTILDSITKNASNLTQQLMDTSFEEPIKPVDMKQIGTRFAQKIHQKLNVKKYEFTSEWYKFLNLCKKTENLGNLKILPPELIANIGYFVIDALQEESIANTQKGFVARPLISELQSIKDSLQEFETLLSGLSSDEFNFSADI